MIALTRKANFSSVNTGSAGVARPEPAVLARGKKFHTDVQKAYVAGLLGVVAEEAIERTIALADGKRGRADILLFVPDEEERMRFVVEIKSTDWTGRPAANRRQLFLRHLRQMHGYLDVLLEEIGDEVDSVVAALLYPRRPAGTIVEELETVALSNGIMVVFYDDIDWASGRPATLE
jgi:hypothetical protein